MVKVAPPEKLPKRYKFSAIEKKWIQRWQDEDLYQFSLSPDDDRPIYSMDTPPPFTSGSLHMGHILNHSWIDFAARYRRMRGYNVYLPQGFDCHGLPTELKVQNEFNVRKQDRELFLEKCIEWTDQCIADMMGQFDQLGYSTDWDYTYRTMNDDYKKMVQKTLLHFYERAWLYRGTHPVHWCTHCETSLAKQEVGYTELPGKIWELKLPLKDSEETVTIATTRPELMEACVGVFVHPRDDRYTDLIGKKVIIPFCDREVEIREDRRVEMDFGTGIVYCCTYGDETDIAWKQEYNLPEVNLLTEDGRMNATSKFQGMTTEEACEAIVKELTDQDLVVSEKPFDHRVIVHTERSSCMEPIEYLPVPQWFIRVKNFTDDIMVAATRMQWFPSHLMQRLQDWCDNLTWDWVISRQRVFGTPIPFWYCEECGEVVVATEDQLPVDPRSDAPPVERCPRCDGPLVGEEAVCDCWVDSSVTPLAIAKWAQDEEFFQRVYPTTMRPQGYEIIRTWLFYTIFRCQQLTGQIPFHEVMINGMVAGSDGRKMSKSFGNTVAPEEVLPYYGSDAVRQWAAMGSLGEDYPFRYHWLNVKNKQILPDEKVEAERKRRGKKFDTLYRKDFDQVLANAKFLTKIWNAYRFIQLQVAKIEPDKITFNDQTPAVEYIEDAYIVGKLNEIIHTMTEAFDKYEWRNGFVPFRTFFWNELCDNYLEAVKYRIFSDDISQRMEAINMVLWVLFHALKLLAPICPFIAEELYHALFAQFTGGPSVHEEAWPELVLDLPGDLKARGDFTIMIIRELRDLKKSLKYALNEDLARVTIAGPADRLDVLRADSTCLQETLRIEQVKYQVTDQVPDSDAVARNQKSLDDGLLLSIPEKEKKK